MKTITVSVDTDGTLSVDVTGYKGPGCEKMTADLEKALGVPGKRTRKPEFHQTQNQQQTQGR